MKEDKVFCPQCRDMVEYTTTKQTYSGFLKGEEVVYENQFINCSLCNEDLYVEEIENQNLKRLYDEYRKMHGIITQEQVMEIPSKYGIGKRPLSKLLGWGELTFTRFYDGDIPTKQYSDILMKIYHDPHAYEDILEQHKDHLDSVSTYVKSRKVLDELFGVHADSKLMDVVTYLLHECGEITPLALQKALYYVQGFYSAFYNKTLFSENCEAWSHGPVYKVVYHRYREYSFDPIQQIDDMDADRLSGEEKCLIDSVIQNLLCYSGKTLEVFTHSELPWMKTRTGLKPKDLCDRIIDKEIICEYFTNIMLQYEMKEPKDIGSYSRDLFRKLH